MKKNFKLGQSNEVIKENKIYDLHNLYDLTGVTLNKGDKLLKIAFCPNQQFGKVELPIFLSFEGIDYLEFNIDFKTSDNSLLDEIGYISPEEINDEFLMDENQANSIDHLFFRLDGENFIRVHSQNAELLD